MTDQKPEPINIPITYPWISFACTFMVLVFFVLIKHPHLIEPQTLPNFFSNPVFQVVLALSTLVILLSDIQRFAQQKKQLKQTITDLEQEFNHIWKNKKKQQERSHIYSGQADKLKRFISNKLLEYIEYDEKFLHFKSIASEVRHNGVISYDIVKSALENAANNAQTKKPTASSFADTHRFGLPNNPNSDYQQALDAMKYLWDLLDLSTAENIALHIGNHLIECEEQYYQIELNNKDTNSNTLTLFKPFFSPAFAAIKSIGPLLDPNQMDKIIAQITKNLHTNKEVEQSTHYHESSLFRIYLSKTENLLGNENHLILLIENIIKNAQFFSSKNKFKQKSDRIAIQLKQKQGFIEYNIYNRGPCIKEDELEQIFQLGYSTRRVKEHHGKGLGLFFAKEIVNGYQGRIGVSNILNQDNSYQIKIQLVNEEVEQKSVATRMDSHRMKVQESEQQNWCESLQWSFCKSISKIEVSSPVNGQTFYFDDLNTQNDIQILDPETPFTPKWQIKIALKRKQWMVKFLALDISGVEFSIKLPTAEACLNGTEPSFMEDFDTEVERLNNQFNELDDF